MEEYHNEDLHPETTPSKMSKGKGNRLSITADEVFHVCNRFLLINNWQLLSTAWILARENQRRGLSMFCG